jgi:hypothetical protein
MGVTLYSTGSPARFTPEGGMARVYINKTGAPSVRGTIVETSDSVDNAVDIIGADEPHPIGVMEHDGIPDGSLCWVVVGGPAYVLLKDSTTATRGYWVRSSDTDAGRADATNASPPGGTVNAIEGHFREIGHAMETVGSGTDVLALIHLHFN